MGTSLARTRVSSDLDLGQCWQEWSGFAFGMVVFCRQQHGAAAWGRGQSNLSSGTGEGGYVAYFAVWSPWV